MLRITRSNRVDLLAQALAARITTDPLRDPMVAETIVLSHRGMARWLQHQLALHLGPPGAGICAHIDFPFPETTIHSLTAWARGQDPVTSQWTRPRMCWALCELIPHLLESPELAQLRHYLRREGSHTDSRLLSISQEISARFDRYAVYRPEIVLQWADQLPAGWPSPRPLPERELWQRTIWKALRARLGPSPAEQVHAALEALQQRASIHLDAPARVSFFGLPFLPPTWLRLLQTLADHIQVDLYLLSPSHHYWGDVRGRRQAGLDGDPAPGLMATLGRVGRDFQAMLAEGDRVYDDLPLFMDPAPDLETQDHSALRILQSDVLHMRDRRLGGEHAPHPLQDSDPSLQFHAAPGPTRQVEILREALLQLLESDPSLEARDILIMSPDHERYAPLVSAVFSAGGGAGEPPRIPVQVADRGLTATNPVAMALVQIMQLSVSRVPMSSVLELLASPVIGPRFGVEAESLERCKTWLSGAGICWGEDAEHRASEGQPETSEHTWQHGLDRLVLGTAIQGPERLFQGLSPWDEIEGSETDLLGKICDFCETLFHHLQSLRETQTRDAWLTGLEGCLLELIEVEDDDQWQIHRTRDAISEWLCPPDSPSSTRSVTPQAMLKLLERILTQGDRGTGHQTGRATFCAMMPMRSIPFRVIALLGMDDGAFPRNPPALGFDLVEQHPRLGDTHPRDEDRYLLLETLLCAQDHLIITWSNRNPCTGKPTPPAVPIGELLDVVDRSLGHAAGPAREVLLREHPLHPFTSRAFGRGEHGEVIAPWSMDPDVLRAAQSLDGHLEPPAALLSGPIAVESLETEIELESLISCLRSPIQRLLRDRLQIRLWEDDSTPTDREELDHEGLRRWESGHALLQAWFQGGTTTDERSLQHARGQLPPGTLGTVAFGAVEEKAQPILAAAQELEEGPAQQIIIDIEIEGVRIHGTVDRVFGARRICAQYGTLRSKHQLDAWIRHLALCVALPERDIITSLVTPHTYKKNEAQQIHLQLSAPEPTAQELLGQLITLYHRASHEPLQIFCESGLHYANSRERGHPRSLAISTANKGWDYDLYSEYLQHAFGSSPRLSEIADSGNFASLSEEVFGPLIRAGAKPMTSSGKKR